MFEDVKLPPFPSNSSSRSSDAQISHFHRTTRRDFIITYSTNQLSSLLLHMDTKKFALDSK